MDIGDRLPSIQCVATNNTTVDFQTFSGKNLVLYFYPKDCTSGCTQEGQDFRDHAADFTKANTCIFGVSRDNLALHEKFKREQAFPLELISDKDETLCQLFDVLRPKNMYGKLVKGIQRSTFLFNKQGILKHVWRNVRVEGHVQEVLRTIQEIENMP